MRTLEKVISMSRCSLFSGTQSFASYFKFFFFVFVGDTIICGIHILWSLVKCRIYVCMCIYIGMCTQLAKAYPIYMFCYKCWNKEKLQSLSTFGNCKYEFRFLGYNDFAKEW